MDKYITYVALGAFNFERKMCCALRGQVTAVTEAVIALPRPITAVKAGRDGYWGLI